MFTVVKDGEVVGKLTNDVERSSELFGMKEQNLVTMILFPITPQKNQFSGVFCADPRSGSAQNHHSTLGFA